MEFRFRLRLGYIVTDCTVTNCTCIQCLVKFRIQPPSLFKFTICISNLVQMKRCVKLWWSTMIYYTIIKLEYVCCCKTQFSTMWTTIKFRKSQSDKLSKIALLCSMHIQCIMGGSVPWYNHCNQNIARFCVS